MWKRLTALLVAALLLWSCCTAEEMPAYASTGRFVRALQGAGIAYAYQGVDEDGDECVLIMSGNHEIYCYFDEACTSATIYVWYLASYEADQLTDILLACSRLNAASGGVCFTADESDNTVTAAMDLLLRAGTAGEVTLDALTHLMKLLPEAERALDLSQRAPLPTAAPTVTPAPAVPVVTPAPTVPAGTPVPTGSGAVPRPAETVKPLIMMTVVITSDVARVRSGPSVTSEYIMTVRQGDAFPCLGRSGSWYIIDCGDRAGFVSMTVSEAR